MKITGTLTKSDYIGVMQQSSFVPRATIRIIILASILPFFAFTLYISNQHSIDLLTLGSLVFLAALLTLIIFNKGIAYATRKYGEFYNLGIATYEIQEQAVVFQGSTFQASIPFDSIINVTKNAQLAYMTFSNNGYFLLPAESRITEGNLDDFIEVLKSRLKNSP